MASGLDHIATLHHSPYILAPAIEAFYRKIEPHPKNILLSYLVLPLILNPVSREKLRKSNINSTVYSLQSKKDVLYGLEDRTKQLKATTNSCLQLLLSSECLDVNSELVVTPLDNALDVEACPKEQLKAAEGLAKILGKIDVVSCFRFLGVGEL